VLIGDLVAFPQRVPAGDYVLVEVEDRGCGMSPEVLNQALDPFFTTKEVGQGTGLGLPMVFGIVQGHHGAMIIESSAGRGTCIRLFLPRLPFAATQPKPVIQTAEVVEPEKVLTRSVLVIDDDQAVLDVVRRFLEIAGHAVTCVTKGQEGLDLLAGSRSFDLVILDLMMPREETRSLFERIRQQRPRIPVLLCTGLPQAEPAPDLVRVRAVSMIRKPFRMNELWYAVNEALRQGAE
jgi:CheY-like chemotaxis protein